MVNNNNPRKGILITSVDALLITACGRAKIKSNGKISAIDRYDGSKFRSIRKYLKSETPYSGLQIIILSAKYGFISSDKPISNYDRKMTKHLARLNERKSLKQFEELTRGNLYRKVMVDLGKEYQPALPNSGEVLSGNQAIEYAEGLYGERMGQVKEWLYDLK